MDQLNADLLPGERLLWSGKPQRIPLLTKMDVILVPAVLFFGLAVFFGVRNGFSPFIWLVLVLVSGAFFSRPVVHYLALRTVTYGITDRRVVVWTRGRQSAAHYLKDLGPPYVRENPDGTGTVGFNLGRGDIAAANELSGLDRSFGIGNVELKYPELLNIEHPTVVRDLAASAQRDTG
ncbi:hypothetical protein GCM10027598_22430 [Amycolatopsis oliviviridis]|uniref:PH domain-containing protein n=1 Tax=Amycolatopsis oliviviridis TaxID=1471590 RepID=A0ABQ3LQV3_9PSEU|nr:hypothetical protein [Amycolatopsis oliviviridis]GHH15493.1 hypothetical protein GCM10017790_30070 [Amycolatopsis oliviviridis]